MGKQIAVVGNLTPDPELRCPVCGGPTGEFWPSGNPEPCSQACEEADLSPVTYVSHPGSATMFSPRDN